MDEKQSINVTIDGHVYPLKVKPSQEEAIRSAVNLINKRMAIYKQKFSVGENQSFDYLAMVAIDLVTKLVSQEKSSDDSDLVTELRILSSEVDEYIQKSQAL